MDKLSLKGDSLPRKPHISQLHLHQPSRAYGPRMWEIWRPRSHDSSGWSSKQFIISPKLPVPSVFSSDQNVNIMSTPEKKKAVISCSTVGVSAKFHPSKCTKKRKNATPTCPNPVRNPLKSQHIPTIPRSPASGHPHPHPWLRMAAPTRDTPPAPLRRRRWGCPTQRTTRDRHSQPDVGGRSQLERRDQSSLPALRLHLAENPLSFRWCFWGVLMLCVKKGLNMVMSWCCYMTPFGSVMLVMI